MKKILPVLLLLLSINSLAQVPKTALDYNNHLAVYSDSLYKLGTEWGTFFNSSFKSGDYSALKDQDMKMDIFIDQGIKNLEQMKDQFNSKPLRMAMIGFLKFEKTLIDKAFKPFEAFNATTPADTVQTAIANLTNLSKDEGAYLQTVGEEQSKFAKLNGFTIEAKKSE